MKYVIQIVDILFPLDKSKIIGIIDIFQEHVKRLGFDNQILYDKMVIFKSNYMTIQNIAQAIYYKQKKSSHIHGFF